MCLKVREYCTLTVPQKKENEHPQGTRPVKKSIPRGCWRQMHPGPMKMLNWTEPFTSRILTYYVQEMNIFHMNQATVESAALSLFFKLQPKAPWVVCRADSASRKAARSSSRFFITRLPTVYQTPPFYSASLLLTAMSPSVLSAASRAGSVFLLWMKHRFGSGRVAQALLTAGSQFQLCLRCTCVALNQ